METLFVFLCDDLRQHPVTLVIVALTLWRVHFCAGKIREVCEDFKSHLVNHAKGEFKGGDNDGH
jgi:hypothetical protein